MENLTIDDDLRKDILRFQREELTGAQLYGMLAKRIKDKKNAAVLNDMANAEKGHYAFWKKLSGVDAPPYRFKVFFLSLAAQILGLTFALKLLEKGEEDASEGYAKVAHLVPEAVKIGQEEEAHEASLIEMIDEERLAYVGSIVLGLNDALVELTGTLAGLTFALQRGSIVAISGIITGIAAAFSMAASDYLASKADGDPRAKKSAIYTGAAYLVTVVLLVLPYLVLPQSGGWIYLSLAITLLIAIGIIAGFNYYLAVAKDQNFKAKFLEMAGISLGVAVFSFVVGLVVRAVFGVDI
ncbi:MAG: VIT1/CCC1 family protein [Spirochaetia bacterium]|jgi:VIT1/CCC1 family predicted Fe2+/Mn2+ transporter|nr:VIT1/CCC1 family protein [Spirochaetia bacterium]